MIILGIDTSSAVCGIALSEAVSDKLKPIAQIGPNIPNTHSEKIMPLLDDLLKTTGVEKKSINAIAISIGPGSFTGLRIGLSTAKGLALGLNIPIVSVPSLDVIAEKVRFIDKTLHIATSSRKDEFYYCSYKQGRRISDYTVLTTMEIINKIEPETVLISDKTEAIINQIPEKTREKVMVMSKEFSYPDVFFVTVLGHRKILNRQMDTLSALVPMYVQGFRGTKV
ncbi:tRNA (adenosine(37)-N6)-threonylcarbamoyltransferase complex dimerization subunit type 1 TsaB [bacterium]|nr:tRNA (adenosine(37)-N6)-threonylcarbamoyltransferase complex dimerization subunit type 1 TsaB [bacterium]